MVGLQAQTPATSLQSGPRPVNLRTDLGQLADLIEIAFASSMDNNGRAAVQEMRVLSKMGAGLGLFSNLNAFSQGMGTGYVWAADGRIVGNVSVYPSEDPQVWIIVNVAVHPDYQRQGIAYQLMNASMEMIRARGGRGALLQVDAENSVARRLYGRLGFMEEREWITWRRSGTYSLPAPFYGEPRPHITHRRNDEWAAEYALAEHVRPQSLGGLGWLRLLKIKDFHYNFLRRVMDWFSFRSVERLIIRSEDNSTIRASMWIENSFASSSTQLTLLVHPDYEGLYDEALVNTAVRRFGNTALTLEHPADRTITTAVLRRYQFASRRDVIHMRWDIA